MNNINIRMIEKIGSFPVRKGLFKIKKRIRFMVFTEVRKYYAGNVLFNQIK